MVWVVEEVQQGLEDAFGPGRGKEGRNTFPSWEMLELKSKFLNPLQNQHVLNLLKG
jgi:hypothetical protein